MKEELFTFLFTGFTIITRTIILSPRASYLRKIILYVERWICFNHIFKYTVERTWYSLLLWKRICAIYIIYEIVSFMRQRAYNITCKLAEASTKQKSLRRKTRNCVCNIYPTFFVSSRPLPTCEALLVQPRFAIYVLAETGFAKH